MTILSTYYTLTPSERAKLREEARTFEMPPSEGFPQGTFSNVIDKPLDWRALEKSIEAVARSLVSERLRGGR